MKAAARLTLGLFLLLLAWFIAKEAIEPHWRIRLLDVLRPGLPPVELSLARGLTLRSYPDTRPHIGKIAPLQKGLVLVHDGRELIEEGYGFGVPILVHEGRYYLSQHATVTTSQDRRQLVKRFTIDVEDTWTEPFRRKYRPVRPLGSVVFTYTVAAPGVLDIEVDFRDLALGPELAYLPNEQGARHFTLYSDSDGVTRDFANFTDQWLPAAASTTCFTARLRGVRFCVETQSGQAKYVGRERYNQYRWSGIFWLSWAGTDIELDKPAGVYRYRLTVEHLGEASGS